MSRVKQGQVKLGTLVEAGAEGEVGLLAVEAEPEMGSWQDLEAEVEIEEEEAIGLLMVVASPEVALSRAPEVETAIPVLL